MSYFVWAGVGYTSEPFTVTDDDLKRKTIGCFIYDIKGRPVDWKSNQEMYKTIDMYWNSGWDMSLEDFVKKLGFS